MEGTTALTAYIATLTEIITALWGYITKVGETIVSTPVLAVPLAFVVLGFAIGAFRRLMNVA